MEVRVRDVAEEVVRRLQLAHVRGEVVGHVLVQPVGQRRVEHLGARVGAPCRTRRPRASCATSSRGIGSPSAFGRERPQHVGVPGPLLEHLRRRLDEVPLGGDAGEPGPRVPAGEHVVHQVAELVEQRDDVVVLHQLPWRSCRPARPRRAGGPAMPGARSNCAAWPYFPVRGCRSRWIRPSRCAVAQHVVRRHVLVPAWRRPATSTYSMPKSRPVTSSSPAPHLGEVEVGADLLGVDVELLAAEHLGVERLVDAVDLGRAPGGPAAAGRAARRSRGGRRPSETSVIRSMNSGIAEPLPIILTSASYDGQSA